MKTPSIEVQNSRITEVLCRVDVSKEVAREELIAEEWDVEDAIINLKWAIHHGHITA